MTRKLNMLDKKKGGVHSNYKKVNVFQNVNILGCSNVSLWNSKINILFKMCRTKPGRLSREKCTKQYIGNAS